MTVEGAELDVGDLADAAAVLSEQALDDDGPAVSGDDLIAMHEFLGGFDGDFQRLFGDHPPGSGPGVGA